MQATTLAMVNKLERCESVARCQRLLTMLEAMEYGAGWTAEDFAILERMNLGLRACWDRHAMRGNDYRAHRNYRENLNA